jgi:hypothetical protein
VWSSNCVETAVTGTQARTASLPAGVYYLNADVAIRFKQGDVTVDTTNAGNYLAAGATVLVEISAAKSYLSFQAYSDSGTCFLNKPSAT